MYWFLNRKIATKMITGFILVTLIAAIVGVIGIKNIQEIEKADTELYEENLIPVSYLGDMKEQFNRLRANMYLAILATDPEEKVNQIGKIKKRREEFGIAYEAFGEIQMSTELKQIYDELEASRKVYGEMLNQAINLIEEGRIEEAIVFTQEDGDFGKVSRAEQNIINKLVEFKINEAKGKSDLNTETADAATITMIGIIIGGVIISIVLGIFLSSIIARPLRKITDAARKLSTGDVDVNITSNTKDEVGILSKAFGEMAQNIKEQAENAQKIAEGNIEIDIVPKSEKDILAKSMKLVIDTLKELSEEQSKFIEAIIHGKLNFRGQTDKFNGVYRDLVDGINQGIGSVVNYLEIIPSPIQFMDKDLNIVYINETGRKLLGKTKEELYGKKCADVWKSNACGNSACPCYRSMKENQVVFTENECTINSKNYDIYCAGAPTKDKQGNIIGSFEFIMDQTDVKDVQRAAQKISDYQAKEAVKIKNQLEKLSEGNLDIFIDIEKGDNDTQEAHIILTEIANAVNSTATELKSIVKEVSDILAEVADKNLAVKMERQYLGDFIKLKDSINFIIEGLNMMLAEINASAEQVEAGADQVASSSQNLSQGASEQAGSVEEIGASITQVSEQTNENAENANKANELSIKAKEDAQIGNEQMGVMLKAMNEIKESSKGISNIIKVIDEIAFQTNILALNAAVEAARAGEHGKGFAVVAEEVRNLAARSAKAAKETTDLIDNSIDKVEEGYKMANDTAEALGQIVTGATNVVEIVGMIANASSEQASALEEVNQGIEQISQVTQTNTATAEESASASEEMVGQAQMLKDLIQEFKLKEETKKISGNTQSPKELETPDKNIIKNDIEISLDDDGFGKY